MTRVIVVLRETKPSTNQLTLGFVLDITSDHHKRRLDIDITLGRRFNELASVLNRHLQTCANAFHTVFVRPPSAARVREIVRKH